MDIEYDSDLGCYISYAPSEPGKVAEAIFPTYNDILSIPIERRVWKTRDGREIFVGDMSRTHIQNSLNWCIRNKENSISGFKDEYSYQDWEAAFLARLLDPDCK